MWLVPRTIGVHSGLARRNAALASRVTQLAETRGAAVDTAAAELRRLERNLHDGAQARLVTLGINLRAAEQLFKTDPDTGDSHTFLVDIKTDTTKGKVTNNGDGTFTYDPNGAFASLAPGQTATDKFLYTVTDGSGLSSTATVTMTITGIISAILIGLVVGALGRLVVPGGFPCPDENEIGVDLLRFAHDRVGR